MGQTPGGNMDEALMLFGTYIYIAAIFLGVTLIAFYFHEGGHFVAARFVGFGDAKIEFQKRDLVPFILRKYWSVPVNLPNRVQIDTEPQRVRFFQMKMIISYLGGIIAGLIPLYITYRLTGADGAVIMLVFYIFYCRKDIRDIYLLFAGRFTELSID
jgi:hypothetical protein